MSSSCRSARASSTDRTSRSPPIRSSPRRWRRISRPDAPTASSRPTVSITASGEHQGFPGTLSIGNEAMHQVVVELVRSADWARAVVLVNGHGGNAAAVDRAVGATRGRGPARPRVVATCRRRRSARRQHRDVADARGPSRPRPARTCRAGPDPFDGRARAVRGVGAQRQRGARRSDGLPRPSTGAELLGRLADDLAHAVDEWLA